VDKHRNHPISLQSYQQLRKKGKLDLRKARIYERWDSTGEVESAVLGIDQIPYKTKIEYQAAYYFCLLTRSAQGYCFMDRLALLELASFVFGIECQL